MTLELFHVVIDTDNSTKATKAFVTFNPEITDKFCNLEIFHGEVQDPRSQQAKGGGRQSITAIQPTFSNSVNPGNLLD